MVPHVLRNTHLLKLSVWVAPKNKRIIIRIIFICHWLVLLVRQHLRDPGALDNKRMFVTNVTPFQRGNQETLQTHEIRCKEALEPKKKENPPNTNFPTFCATFTYIDSQNAGTITTSTQWLYRQTATKHTCNPASTITSTHKCIQECVLVL